MPKRTLPAVPLSFTAESRFAGKEATPRCFPSFSSASPKRLFGSIRKGTERGDVPPNNHPLPPLNVPPSFFFTPPLRPRARLFICIFMCTCAALSSSSPQQDRVGRLGAQVLHPKPKTQNPKPKTQNPKPLTHTSLSCTAPPCRTHLGRHGPGRSILPPTTTMCTHRGLPIPTGDDEMSGPRRQQIRNDREERDRGDLMLGYLLMKAVHTLFGVGGWKSGCWGGVVALVGVP